jgi:hypothetical protein
MRVLQPAGMRRARFVVSLPIAPQAAATAPAAQIPRISR